MGIRGRETDEVSDIEMGGWIFLRKRISQSQTPSLGIAC